MTPESFVYWLHGFFEIAGTTKLNAAQSKMVKEHLDLVFVKFTPPLGTGIPIPPYPDWYKPQPINAPFICHIATDGVAANVPAIGTLAFGEAQAPLWSDSVPLSCSIDIKTHTITSPKYCQSSPLPDPTSRVKIC